MGTGSFPGVKSGRGVTLTPYPFQCRRQERVELYLYSPYGPYGMYRASVPVQYSYTCTPPMCRTACTEPQYLYSTAIPLLPLWAVRPVQSLSACSRVHFTLPLPVRIPGDSCPDKVSLCFPHSLQRKFLDITSDYDSFFQDPLHFFYRQSSYLCRFIFLSGRQHRNNTYELRHIKSFFSVGNVFFLCLK
jgi:hypothetical protein